MSDKSDRKQIDVSRVLEGIQRYDPKHSVMLEKYLYMQAEKGFYNREANCALLSIYRYWPETFNEKCACLILLKAIMELPQSDFALCKIMLTRFETGVVNSMVELGTLLESCQFIKFWESYQSMVDDGFIRPEELHGFEKAVRRYICYAIELSFQSIEVIMLKQMLNHPSDNMLDEIIDANNWRFLPANRKLEKPESVYTFDHTNVVKGTKVFTGPKLQDVLKSLH